MSIKSHLRSKLFILILIILSLLIGFINLEPQLLIKKGVEKNGNLYLPIQITGEFNDEALWYIPISKKISQKFLPFNDFYFDQYQRAPSSIPLLPNYIYAFLFLFSHDVTKVFLAGIFIFPAILFLLFYFLGMVFFKNKLLGIFLASFMSLATIVVRDFSGVLRSTITSLINFFVSAKFESFQPIYHYLIITLKFFIPKFGAPFLNYSLIAITDPLLTYLSYIPAIAALFLFILKPSFKRAIFAGIFLGLLFYVYLYYWLFLSIIVGLFLIYSFVKKDWSKVREIVFLISIMVLISIPYLISSYNFFHFKNSLDIAARIGMEHGRYFRTMVWEQYLVLLIFEGINFLVFWKKDFPRFIFYSLVFLAAFLVYNLQLIFGFIPQPDHWARTLSPLLFIFVIDFCRQIIYSINKNQILKISQIAVIILICLLFSTAIINLLRFQKPSLKLGQRYSFNQDIYDSYNWINNHSARYISPSYVTSYYLSLYTSAKVYLAPAANSSASNWELEQRFLEAMKFFNLSPQNLAHLLRDEKENYQTDSQLNQYLSYNLYLNYYQDQSFNYSMKKGFRHLPEAKIEELLNRYQDLNFNRSDFKGDYVYFGPFEKEIIKNYHFADDKFQLVYQNDQVNIYKIL